VLEPQELDDVALSVKQRLEVRYNNKVIQGEGPCLLIQTVEILDQIVIQNEASLQVTCTFECLIFKPLVGSVITGQLCD